MQLPLENFCLLGGFSHTTIKGKVPFAAMAGNSSTQ